MLAHEIQNPITRYALRSYKIHVSPNNDLSFCHFPITCNQIEVVNGEGWLRAYGKTSCFEHMHSTCQTHYSSFLFCFFRYTTRSECMDKPAPWRDHKAPNPQRVSRGTKPKGVHLETQMCAKLFLLVLRYSLLKQYRSIWLNRVLLYWHDVIFLAARSLYLWDVAFRLKAFTRSLYFSYWFHLRIIALNKLAKYAICVCVCHFS